MTQCLVGLGSNLGDPQENLARAIELLRATPGVDDVAVSSFLATTPIGGPTGQPEFLNAAARITTNLTPLALLDALQQIEMQLGRTRDVHWGPRTIDLDLLLFGEEVIHSPRLTVPHPRLATRKFALLPASEVAGEMRHPQIGWTIRELLDHLLHAHPYFVVTADDDALAAHIASDAAAAIRTRLSGGEHVEVAAVPRERLKFLTAAPKLLAIVGDHSVAADVGGPTLQLPAERAAAAQELIAAIEAMQL